MAATSLGIFLFPGVWQMDGSHIRERSQTIFYWKRFTRETETAEGVSIKVK